ncbi:MAG TPA: IclR family transcriptional regulator [Alphaproteobacteria bacterium]|nr:IclR family transcriptional regulator [Alphaproteobacteria bacterium]
MRRNASRPTRSREARPTSVEKAIDVLFCFDLHHPQLRLVDISRRLGLHKSTAYRLLSLLKKRGLVAVDPANQLYSLGPGLIELAWIVLRQQDLRTICRPYLEELRRATNETVSVHVRIGDKRVCVEELESGHEVKFSETLGLTAPIHVGAPGKALLAFLSEDELSRLLPTLSLTPITPETITDLGALQRELAATRAQGYAISRGERSPLSAAVAAPIRDRSGQPVAAISVGGPVHRLTSKVIKDVAGQVMKVAGEISIALGYRAE